LAAGRLSTTDARRIADALVWRHAEAPLDQGRTLDIPTLVGADSVAISRIAHEIPELAIPELRAAGNHQADWLQQQEGRLLARGDAGRIAASVVSLRLDEVWLEPENDVHISFRTMPDKRMISTSTNG
jgi:hypothetical protein